MPEFQKFFTDADRKQALSDALMQRAFQSRAPQQQGRITPKMGLVQGLAPIAEALLSKRISKQASGLREQGDEAKREAMVAALQGLGGQDTMVAGNEGAAMPPANPYQSAQSAIDAGVHPALVTQYMKSHQPQQPDPTDDMREYEFARNQGYQGSFEDFLLDPRRRGGTTVNVKNEGTIPAGFRAVRDDQGNLVRYEPVPGGPAAQKAADAEEAAANLQESKERQGDIVTQEIDRALTTLDSPGLPETGLFGNLLKDVPGTDAHKVQNLINTIKANIGFDKLQAMREASPTGGALGQVSEREIDFLQSVLGSLAQSQRKEDFRYNLNRLWNTYQDIVHGPGNGPERRPLNPPQTQPAAGGMPDFSTMSDEDLKRIASGG